MLRLISIADLHRDSKSIRLVCPRSFLDRLVIMLVATFESEVEEVDQIDHQPAELAGNQAPVAVSKQLNLSR